ncbi:hypothetical protein D3C72_1905530 [compost metagenome]
MGNVVAVVGVERHADLRQAIAPFTDQLRHAQHVGVGAGHGQGRCCAGRQPFGGQVAKIVLRVDDEQVQLAFHGGPRAWRELA